MDGVYKLVPLLKMGPFEHKVVVNEIELRKGKWISSTIAALQGPTEAKAQQANKSEHKPILSEKFWLMVSYATAFGVVFGAIALIIKCCKKK